MIVNQKNDGIAGGIIDYRELAARFDFSDHAHRSDQYFGSLELSSSVARKPFASPGEAASICSGLAALLPELHLFAGARVLDFGAGTCWLSRILALLGCEVYAADVSEKALSIGRQLIERDPLSAHLKVEYVPLREARLPFSDEFFDRVVCFDALHHVPDQEFAVREFGRVLRAGGIAGFHDAGPRHSLHPQSQYEMRMHGVVEGDVDVDALVKQARTVGITSVRSAAFSIAPTLCEPAALENFAAGRRAPEVEAGLIHQARAAQDNLRVFFFHKGDPLAHLDSRGTQGLAGELDLVATSGTNCLHVTGSVRNAGQARWLGSFSGIGAVNLGAHLQNGEGRVLDHDYARCPLGSDGVLPGQSVSISWDVPIPQGEGAWLTFDLVAEGVDWFELLGGKPFTVHINHDLPAVMGR